jgi:hypothetical protein
MSKALKLFAVVASVSLVSQPANAQSCSISSTLATVSCTVGTTVSMTVPSLMNLTLNATAATLAAPTAVGDFDGSGLANFITTGPSFQARANRSYRVQISADAATFTATPVAGAVAYNKPASEVHWSNDATAFVSLSTTPTDVGTGSATSLSAAKVITYKTFYDITKDQPGAYSLGVTFTLVAP